MSRADFVGSVGIGPEASGAHFRISVSDQSPEVACFLFAELSNVDHPPAADDRRTPAGYASFMKVDRYHGSPIIFAGFLREFQADLECGIDTER